MRYLNCSLFFLLSVFVFNSSLFAAQTCTTTSIAGANDFEGISGTSDSNVISVGKAGDIYRYDGTAWGQLTSPTGEDLKDIFLLDPTTGYAVGKKGTILFYDGTTWSSMASGTNEEIKGVWAFAGNEVYAVGKKGTLLFYDGSSWSDISGAAGVGNNDLEKVWGNGSFVYVLGKDGTLYIHDRAGAPGNAAFWGSDNTCGGTDFKDLWLDNTGNLYLTGKNGSVYLYDGSSCSIEATAADELTGIHGSIASGEIYAVGKNGGVMYYNGTTWQAQTQGAEDLKDVWLADSSNVYYSGKNAEVTTCTGTPDPPPATPACTTTSIAGANDFEGISGTSDNNVISIGKAGDIYRYDGTSWVQMTSPTGEDLKDIFLLDPTTGYAVGKKGTILSYDGTTWNSMASGTNEEIKGVWAFAGNEVYAVGKKGTLLFYDGSSWSDISGAAGVGNNDLEKVWGNGSFVYVLGKDGTLYIHDRAGAPGNAAFWSSDNTCGGTDFKDLWLDNTGNLYLTGKNGSVYLYDGSSCSIEATAGDELTGIHGSSISGEIYAVGKKGGVMYYNGTTWQAQTQGTEDLKDVWVSAGGTAYYSGKGGEVTICTPPVGGVDHLSIVHDGTGINCQAEPVTIMAHDSAHTIVTGYTGTVSLATATSHGDWSVITGNPANLINSGSGAATYSFDGTESGVVVLGLKDTFVETVNIDASDGPVTEQSGTALASEDLALVFAEAGFNFLADGVIAGVGNQIGGKVSNIAPGSQILELEAVRTSDATGQCEAALVGANAIELAFECRDPAACTANLVNISGVDIAANNDGAVGSYTGVLLDFGNNADTTATFTLLYPDVGQLRLHARYNIPLGSGAPSGNLMVGASNNFVVRPFGFDISATGNPGATSAVGAVYTSAGSPFNAIVRAVLWQVGDDADNDGVPDNHSDIDPANNADLTDNTAALNFGQETAAEDVLISSLLLLPVGGTDPGLAGTTTATAFSNGVATTAVQFDEVGIIETAANLSDASYLGTGSVIGRSGHVGRFTPARFNVTINPDPPVFSDACVVGGYTYLGEIFNFTVNPTVTLTAMNDASPAAVTRNYDCGGFWQFATPMNLLYTYTDSAGAGPNLSPAGNIVSPAAVETTDCNGSVQLALADNFTYSRPSFSAPVAPFAASVDLAIGQAPLTDTDAICYDIGAGCQNFNRSAIAGTTLRHGKIQVFNNFGPETADITNSPFAAQDFDGANWVTHVNDNCSTGLVFCSDPDSGRVSSIQPSPLNGGRGTFTVAAGTSGERLDVCPTAPAWLTDLVDCATPDDTCGEFSFGLYRGNDRIINWQEIVR